MSLELVMPNESFKDAWYDIVREFESNNERIVPFALTSEAKTFEEFLEISYKNANNIDLPIGRVPSEVYFLVDTNTYKILGAIDLRLELNDYLAQLGGHIGYGVRPSERQKGYASYMLGTILEICKKKEFNRVLITCDSTNVASAKTMMRYGAVLENEIENNGIKTQRYWITL